MNDPHEVSFIIQNRSLITQFFIKSYTLSTGWVIPDPKFSFLIITRKYPLRGYVLGVLTHTTAWDRNWGGDETLKLVLVYIT